MLGTGKYMIPVINVIIGTFTFLTGLHVEQVMKSDICLPIITCEIIMQIVTFFEKICCAAPGRSYMYNIAGSWLNKITYNYWLKMQVGFHLSSVINY